jgi:hypothetical protein
MEGGRDLCRFVWEAPIRAAVNSLRESIKTVKLKLSLSVMEYKQLVNAPNVGASKNGDRYSYSGGALMVALRSHYCQNYITLVFRVNSEESRALPLRGFLLILELLLLTPASEGLHSR